MSRNLLKYLGGFLLCVVVNAIVNGLGSDFGVFNVHPQTHIPLPAYQTSLMSIWYSLVVIMLYWAWSLYVLPLLIFHVSARYLETYDYSSYIVLSTLIWFSCGLVMGMITGSTTLVLSYSIIGAVYGLYYRRWLFDQAETE